MSEVPPESPPPAPPPGVLPRAGTQDAEIAAQFRRTLLELTPHAWVTWVILAANVVVFGVMLADHVHPLEPQIADLLRWGANYAPFTTHGEPWRLASAMFIHIGLLHIAMNMLVLADIGRFMERLLGSGGFLATYLTAGLAGSIASTMANPNVVSAGASGAVFGLYGALFGFLARDRESIPKPVLRQLVRSGAIFVGYNVIYGFSQPNIDQAAHFGGLAGGFLCGLLLSQPIRPELRATRPRHALRAVALGLLLAAAGVFALPAKANFAKDFQTVIAPEHDMAQRLLAAAGDHDTGKLSKDQYLAVLEDDVLRGWQQIEKGARKLESANSRQREIKDALVAYASARREWIEALIKSTRSGDPADESAANTKLTESGRRLETLNDLVSKP